VAAALFVLLLVTPGVDACRRAFGRDFLAFYTAGTLVREGRAADLYNLDAVRKREQQVSKSAGIDLGESVAPWWNPPVYAWAFALLSELPFHQALLAWTAVNLVAAAAAAWLLGRLVAPDRGSDRALVALLVFVSAPLLQSLAHGQNSAISLLLVTLAVRAWRARDTFTASACLGLLLYKPQLAVALAAALVLHRGWRAAAGFVFVGLALYLLTDAAMPGALADYLHRLPVNLHAIQVEQTYLWDRHVTLQAFWRLLLQGRAAGETSTLVTALTVVSAAPLALGLPVAARRTRSTETLVAATVVAAPLLMPFYFDYDLLLLAVAAALGRRLTALWSALYLWLFINPYVAGAVRFNVTVPLLWALAEFHLRVAARKQREFEVPPEVIELFTQPLDKAA
jgi:hypothetical protein